MENKAKHFGIQNTVEEWAEFYRKVNCHSCNNLSFSSTVKAICCRIEFSHVRWWQYSWLRMHWLQTSDTTGWLVSLHWCASSTDKNISGMCWHTKAMLNRIHGIYCLYSIYRQQFLSANFILECWDQCFVVKNAALLSFSSIVSSCFVIQANALPLACEVWK